MHKNLSKIKGIVDKEASNTLSSKQEKVFGLINDKIKQNVYDINNMPYLVMKYNRTQYQCFSDWGKAELNKLSAFINKLQNTKWEEIQSPNSGFGYKSYDISKTHSSAQKHFKDVKKLLSEEISFFELRVDKKARVHGFRVNSAFFIVLFDKNHEVFPE